MRFYSFVLSSAFIIVTVARAALELNNFSSIFPTTDDSPTANHSPVSDPQQLRTNTTLPFDENRISSFGAALKSILGIDKHLLRLLPRRMNYWVEKRKPAEYVLRRIVPELGQRAAPPISTTAVNTFAPYVNLGQREVPISTKTIHALVRYVKRVSEKYPREGGVSAADDMYTELKKHFHDRQLTFMFHTAAGVADLKEAAMNLQNVQINRWLREDLSIKVIHDYLGVRLRVQKGQVDGPRIVWRAYTDAYNKKHGDVPGVGY